MPTSAPALIEDQFSLQSGQIKCKDLAQSNGNRYITKLGVRLDEGVDQPGALALEQARLDCARDPVLGRFGGGVDDGAHPVAEFAFDRRAVEEIRRHRVVEQQV